MLFFNWMVLQNLCANECLHVDSFGGHVLKDLPEVPCSTEGDFPPLSLELLSKVGVFSRLSRDLSPAGAFQEPTDDQKNLPLSSTPPLNGTTSSLIGKGEKHCYSIHSSDDGDYIEVIFGQNSQLLSKEEIVETWLKDQAMREAIVTSPEGPLKGGESISYCPGSLPPK